MRTSEAALCWTGKKDCVDDGLEQTNKQTAWMMLGFETLERECVHMHFHLSFVHSRATFAEAGNQNARSVVAAAAASEEEEEEEN